MKSVTKAMQTAVNTYLNALAFSELQRERVDKIQRRLLETAEYWPDKRWGERRDMERIVEPKYTYLMDEQESECYLLDLRAELEKAGYTIEDIPGEGNHCYKCPALVAESMVTDCERAIIAVFALEMGEEDTKEFFHKLICAGLDTYHKFIDLCVKAVVAYDKTALHPLVASRV